MYNSSWKKKRRETYLLTMWGPTWRSWSAWHTWSRLTQSCMHFSLLACASLLGLVQWNFYTCSRRKAATKNRCGFTSNIRRAILFRLLLYEFLEERFWRHVICLFERSGWKARSFAHWGEWVILPAVPPLLSSHCLRLMSCMSKASGWDAYTNTSQKSTALVFHLLAVILIAEPFSRQKIKAGRKGCNRSSGRDAFSRVCRRRRSKSPFGCFSALFSLLIETNVFSHNKAFFWYHCNNNIFTKCCICDPLSHVEIILLFSRHTMIKSWLKGSFVVFKLCCKRTAIKTNAGIFFLLAWQWSLRN